MIDPTEDPYFEVRNALFREIVLLTDLWQQYRTLFMTSSARVTRLNEHARWFFHTVQRTFLHELILGVARITDQAESRGRKNVTLAALLKDPRAQADAELAQQLHADLAAAAVACAPIRKHRNRRIAHLDHRVAFGKDPLPGLTLVAIREAIEHLQRVHDRYGGAVLERGASYELHPFGSAAQLVETLDIAPTRRERALRKELEDLRHRHNQSAAEGGAV